MKRFRQIVTYLFYAGFYLACTGAVVILIFSGGLIVSFSSFDGSTEIVDRSGPATQRSLNNWPDAVIPENVLSVSYRRTYSRDSHSLWFKVVLNSESAQIWANHIHTDKVKIARNAASHHHGLEAVHRTVPGPPELRRHTGTIPAWWKPPTLEFQATEAMIWYSEHTSSSGVARAAYTAYDENSQTLWIYEYGCQHDLLWKPRKIPAGEILNQLKDIEQEDFTEPENPPASPIVDSPN